MTATVGGIVLDAVDIGLTGVQATSSVGTLSHTNFSNFKQVYKRHLL